MTSDIPPLPTSFTYAAVRAAGLSDRRLSGLVREGILERFGRGVYRKSEAPPVDLDLVEIALRAPEATLCLTSALSHHDLTDAIPTALDIALPRSRRPPRVAPPVRWHRFHEETFALGRESLEVDGGVFLGVYGAERCIVDAFRLRHQEGEEVAVEALRRWLRRTGSIPARLLDLARSFPKGEPALLRALQVLL